MARGLGVNHRDASRGIDIYTQINGAGRLQILVCEAPVFPWHGLVEVAAIL